MLVFGLGSVRIVNKRDFEFEQRLSNRSYPTALVHKILTEVQFSDRTEAFPNKTKKQKKFDRLLLLVTQLHRIIRPSVSNTLSLQSRISYRNSTEQTKLAPDHLLTTPSFSLPTTIFYIYKQALKKIRNGTSLTSHRPTWSRNSPISQSLRAECPKISCMGELAPGPNPLNAAAY